jgi:hypothetical protein
MTYQQLLTTDNLATDMVTKWDSNFLRSRWLNVVTKTSSFTADADDVTGNAKDLYIVDTTTGAVTATLPSASLQVGRVRTFLLKNATSTLTIDGNGATINGASTVVLSTTYSYRTVVSDGTQYFVIGEG